MTADPLVRVTGLRKAFGAHRVLDGLALEVRAGEAVALLGANGAGKTTRGSRSACDRTWG